MPECKLIKSNFVNIAFSGQNFIGKAVEQTAITNVPRTFDNVEILNHLTKTTSSNKFTKITSSSLTVHPPASHFRKDSGLLLQKDG